MPHSRDTDQQVVPNGTSSSRLCYSNDALNRSDHLSNHNTSANRTTDEISCLEIHESLDPINLIRSISIRYPHKKIIEMTSHEFNQPAIDTEEGDEDENVSSSVVSTAPSTSNHHYLYQSQRHFSSQVNRNPNHNLLVSTIIPDSTSIVSAASSNGNGSNDAETVNTATTVENDSRSLCHWCQEMFSIPPDADKRLARSYRSFVIGRFLGVLSSIGLVLGLTVKFFFLDESSSFASVLSYVIIAFSLLVFFISAALVIWATLYKSAKARREFLEAQHPTLKSSEPPFLKQVNRN